MLEEIGKVREVRESKKGDYKGNFLDGGGVGEKVGCFRYRKER